MRNRLLVCLPIASLLMVVLFASVSTFVRAIELDDAAVDRSFAVRSDEATCDDLRHEIHALSHAESACVLSPECEGSPLLCPRVRDGRIEREYERLRDALHDRCGLPRGLLDYAWVIGEHAAEAEGCELVHDGFESAVRGEARPATYSF